MFNLSLLISHITATTGYPTEFAREKEPMLSEVTQLPSVTVGYFQLNQKDITGSGNLLTGSNFQITAELIQEIEVQIICTPATLHLVQRIVYDACVQWMPNPNTAQAYSGLTYKVGGVVGLDNGRLHWLDRWELDLSAIGS